MFLHFQFSFPSGFPSRRYVPFDAWEVRERVGVERGGGGVDIAGSGGGATVHYRQAERGVDRYGWNNWTAD